MGRDLSAGPAVSPRVELRLAGTFGVVRDGTGLSAGELGSRKSRTLLKLLAVERPALVPVDRIIEVLWDGDHPAGATQNVASLVSRLRGVLERILDAVLLVRLITAAAEEAGAGMTELAMPRPPEDTPRWAYRALERRVTVTTAAVLLALAGVAWWRTAGESGSMSAMVQGFAHVGVAMPFDMTIPVFMAMWATMMIAMMFPAVAPIVLMHRLVTRHRGEGVAPTLAFGASYLVVWSLVGLVPLAVLIGFRQVTTDSAWLDRTGGLVLLLAGAYQFSPWKTTCLRACRTPLSFLLTHDFGGGLTGAVRVGLSHGLYCLGCCWALMAVLFTVGLMNLAWMAGIAVVFLAEKNWRHGVGLTRLIGIATVLFGVAVLIHPSLLATVAPFKAPPPMPMNG